MDACRWDISSDQADHAIPGESSALAAAQQGALPKPAHPVSEQPRRGTVHGDSVVTAVSRHNHPQPLAHLRDGIVHSPSQLDFDFGRLRLQPLWHGLSQDRETPYLVSNNPCRQAGGCGNVRPANHASGGAGQHTVRTQSVASCPGAIPARTWRIALARR